MSELDDKITGILADYEAGYVAAQNDNFNGAKAHQNDEAASNAIKALVTTELEAFAAELKAHGDPVEGDAVYPGVIDRLLAERKEGR